MFVSTHYVDNVEESKAHKDGITIVSSTANQAALAESEWGLCIPNVDDKACFWRTVFTCSIPGPKLHSDHW